MANRLPSLNSFRVFEAAARQLSFTRAAEELFVSQAAVSQQIRQLEEQLGYPLFRRLNRRLLLTDEGQRLLPYTSDALSTLREGINEVSRQQQQQPLNISVIPSFAYRWLVPRLMRYATLQPQQEVRLSASITLVDFNNSDADMAIRFGAGDYPGLRSEFLMADEAFPVCCPSVLQEGGGVQQPQDLLNYRLIHDMGPGDLNWEHWFELAGASYQPTHKSYTIGDSSLALEAVSAGQGIALARASLVEQDLANGRLVRPFPDSLSMKSDYSYYLVMPESKRHLERVQMFCDWIQSVA